MSATFQSIAETRQYFGWSAAARRTASRTAQKLLRLEVNEMLWLAAESLPSAVPADPDFAFHFLTPNQLAYFSRTPTNDVDEVFALCVGSGHDFCFAAVAKTGELASYSWYAVGSIEAEHHLGVAMSLPPGVAYMYKAFTHPNFRGKRLYGATVALAFQALAAKGVRNLVTTVEWTNFSSLRSCRRLGFQPLGRLATIGPLNHRIALTPQSARVRGIRFGRSAEVHRRCP